MMINARTMRNVWEEYELLMKIEYKYLLGVQSDVH